MLIVQPAKLLAATHTLSPYLLFFYPKGPLAHPHVSKNLAKPISAMSDDSSYSGEESSAYSYKDLAIYQYSDVEGEEEEENPPKQAVVSLQGPTDALEDWEDNGSYVMYTQSDDEFELYQFSDEDLIPEYPDEEWIVAALLGQRSDYTHLELLLTEIDDFPRLIEAMKMNHMITNVTVYKAFFDAVTTTEEKVMLAEAVCNLPNLEYLKVYFHSSFFVKPLERIRPPTLKRLCLMFFPGIADKSTLTTLTNILKAGDEPSKNDDDSDNSDDDTRDDAPENELDNQTMSLKSLALRCDLMDDAFIEAIASGMETNLTVTTLSFWGNNTQVSEKGSFASSKIDFYLKLNQCGIRDFHLLVNATPSEFLDKVVDEHESLDLVFYLLQTNPSFLSYCDHQRI